MLEYGSGDNFTFRDDRRISLNSADLVTLLPSEWADIHLLRAVLSLNFTLYEEFEGHQYVDPRELSKILDAGSSLLRTDLPPRLSPGRETDSVASIICVDGNLVTATIDISTHTTRGHQTARSKYRA